MKTLTSQWRLPAKASLRPVRSRLPKQLLLAVLLSGSTLLHAQVPANSFNYSRSSAFEYDANGLLTAEIIEPDNPQLCVRTEYLYDSIGNRTQTLTKNCPGASGTALFTQRQLTASYAANAVNLVAGQYPTSTTNALNQSETKQYDNRFAAVTKLTGPNGLSTQWQYDSFGRKTKEIRADGTQTTWVYEYCNAAYGTPVAATACPSLNAGNTATLAYVITTTPQNSAGVQNGPQSKAYIDLLGRTVRSEIQRANDSAWIYSETFYNTLGQVTKKSEPALVGSALSLFTTYTYDALGRVIQETHPDSAGTGGIATSTIAYNGRTTVTTNARGQAQTKEKDPQGRLIRVTDHQGNQIAYQYDAFDNLLKTIDPLGNTSTLSYDIRGRKIAMNDPDMGAWTYVYDAVGQLISQTDAKNQTTQMQYDVLGRLIAKLQPTQNNYWVYDKYADNSACTKGIGKLCETYSDNGYRQKVSFDTLGRPLSTSTTVDQVYTSSVTYDTQGRIATQVWPTGVTVQNTYNTLGAVTAINRVLPNASLQLLWQPLEYNVRGQLTRFKYGNNIETVQSYAADTGRLTAIQAGPGNGVQNHQYQFDVIGNLTQRIDTNTNVTETYTYDSLNRVQTQSLISGATTRTNTWTYNALGNILNQTEVGAYAYNPSGVGSTRPHAITQVTGTVGSYLNPQYTYDAAGNLASVTSSNGNSRSHFFTSFNMPQSLGSSGANPASAAFIYGTDHQRVKEIFARVLNGTVKTRTVYQIHPDNAGGLFYERELKEDGSIEHRHYVGGSVVLTSVGTGTQMLTVTATRYWHKDHLGSTAVVTDETGIVIERLAYDPFGKRRYTNGVFDANGVLRSSTTDRGYTGHEHLDDLGFIHMNGRVYDPMLGRFLSADPFIQYPDNLQSYNRYAYLFNNPLNATDPTGYRWKFSIGGHNIGHTLSKAWHNQVVQDIHHPVQAVLRQVDQRTGQALVALGTAICTASVVCAPFAPLVAAAGNYDNARAHGATQGQAIRSGVVAGATAYAFSVVGDVTNFHGVGSSQFLTAEHFANMAGHALVGCASAAAMGGTCRSGAMGAAVGSFATPLAAGAGDVGGFFVVSAAGGLGAKLAGGSFQDGATTAAYGYLFNQLGAKYRLSTGVLSMTDQDSGLSVQGKFKVATEGGMPLTPGEYDILEGPNGRYRLERIDKLYGDDRDATTGQVNIRLHGPGNSLGCLTADSAKDWTPVNAILKFTSTTTATVYDITDIGAILKGYNPGYESTRIYKGTVEIKKYGRLSVEK